MALNTDATPATIEALVSPVGFPDGTVLEDRLGSDVDLVVEGGRLRVTLPSMSSAVFAAP